MMTFPAPSAKITVFQRRANALERGTGIESEVSLHDFPRASNSNTSPSGEVAMMDSVIFTDAFLQRFWAKVNKDAPNGCWEWTACLIRGYGVMGVAGKSRGAHRISYTLFVGPIPEDLHIDHLCRNRKCVNPAHLEAVTLIENNRRSFSPYAINSRKTHCYQGHPFSGNNLFFHRDGSRRCRACYNESRKRRRDNRQSTNSKVVWRRGPSWGATQKDGTISYADVNGRHLEIVRSSFPGPRSASFFNYQLYVDHAQTGDAELGLRVCRQKAIAIAASLGAP